MHQDRRDDEEINRLLADGEPGVDAPEREDVEEKAGDEERYGEAALVARRVELDPLQGAGGSARRVPGYDARRSLEAQRRLFRVL